jgi:hypothetical protein
MHSSLATRRGTLATAASTQIAAIVPLADQAAVSVEGGLPGDEYDAPGANFDHLRIARRLAELGRVVAPDRSGRFAAHVMLHRR